ncbi:biotin synthase [Agathobacter rectalis]|uniref:Biotin synthase n=1 Tax=Agathobacter rectalis TaxID=39491 RepID=A0A174IHE2_9FIRM|nr:biotin synthase [Agathobacter rectalis]
MFINRDTNGEGVLKVGTTLIRVSTVMGILYNKCNYCSMNVENTELKRYTLTLEEIQKSVDEGIKNGIRVFHLSSGENCEFSDGLLLDMVEYIYEKGCKIILVIGKRKYSLLKKLYEKGVSVFISKFETSNPWLYSEYNNKNGSHDLRVEYLRKLREIGYKIGTGNIVGLPFQRDSTLYEDLKLLCKLHSEQASTSRFISNPYSKYSKYETSYGKSSEKLNWDAIVSKKGETRVEHIKRHTVQNNSRETHSVFNGNPIDMVNDAWEQRHLVEPISDGMGGTIYNIPYKNAGYESGYINTGAQMDYITIVTLDESTDLITAFPSFGDYHK